MTIPGARSGAGPGRHRRPGRAPARAALAGNPSDGYGGAVLALSLDMLEARVNLIERPRGVRGGRLTQAVLDRCGREFGIDLSADGVRMVTSIPRSVGLGGSSAIVIATLRAVLDAHRVELEPLALAELALSIEVDDLDIAAGLQDRLVQVHGGLVFMDFSGPRATAEPLPYRRLPPLLVAWRGDTAAGSGTVHGDLRARWVAGDPGVREGMVRLGHLAREARSAVLAADGAGLAAAVDGSFDVRAGLMELDPRHVEMVAAGRAAGAAVNYTGSGGAVVCVCRDSDHRETVAAALRALGAETIPA